ncbi:hypothetical protein ASPZODRAFT_20275 [Penicilliopsis zonata CBS 506.65]|uniref:Glycosyl hydrolase family 13 catalytic domain-containing protein n=1 Tax=Penicilliopsis zonata CBS 506.65 TaxID=1073090 RepID=A0A1L9S6I6_9EURO|nr:hypothetical protein ASPZODRAFT_20275 [Penicilliopsis zonata CBS 506.65]OJJ42750.1 hypothetical protein ASPZODRAFT_20275 [Penicilliopsis zonata CBS 506.65]
MNSPEKCEIDTTADCGEIDTLDKMRWWQRATIYQVLIQSFQDTNGDGKGDIRGVVNRLDYFVTLGVDVIWIAPIYQSPMSDMGYDISDYYTVNPIFGSMEDMELLISETHKRDMKIILDIALNHTSSEHQWFQTSRRSRKDRSLGKRDWYFWSEGKVDETGKRIPPNNWESTFTGSTWEWDDMAEEFYLHIFGKNQPDLNWDCEDVRQALYNVLRFWLDKGIDGFRLDTMNLVSKTSEFPDAPIVKKGSIWQPANFLFANGPHIHEYLQEMYEQVFSKYDVVTLGEMSCGVSPAQAVEYTSRHKPRPELSLVIQFQHVELDCYDGDKWLLREWELPELKAVINEWQATLIDNGGWNTLWMENHDQPRAISRFTTSHPRFRALCAKLLCVWQYTLQGTNLIFQGQELGMVNPGMFTEEMNQDIETAQYWKAACEAAGSEHDEALTLAKKAIIQKGRDNTRIPIPWTDAPHGGFTEPDCKPWIPASEHGKDWCCFSQQKDPESVWSFYRAMIRMRKNHPTLYYGTYETLDMDNPFIWAYKRRSKLRCYLTILNFSSGATSWAYAEHGVDLKGSKLLISNYLTQEATLVEPILLLRPFEGRLKSSQVSSSTPRQLAKKAWQEESDSAAVPIRVFFISSSVFSLRQDDRGTRQSPTSSDGQPTTVPEDE